MRWPSLCVVAVLGLAACTKSISSNSCGKEDQPCCLQTPCADGLVCGSAQTCERCGASGQACCAQDTCTGPLVCSGGQCASCGGSGERCCTGDSPCQAGLTCAADHCGCADACTPGAQRCTTANGIESCQGSGSGCAMWQGVIAACPTGQACQGDGGQASCVDPCPGACIEGSFLCTPYGVRKCVKAPATECSAFVAASPGEGPPCTQGACTEGGFCWEYPVPLGENLVAINGWASDQLLLLDRAGNVVRREGEAWKYEVHATKNQRARALASCISPGRFAVVGDRGLVMRRVFSGWVTEAVPTTADLTVVACDSATRAIVAGKFGTVAVRSDTGSWRVVDAGINTTFFGSAYDAAHTDGLLLGPSGVILRCGPLYDTSTTTCVRESAGLTSETLYAGWSDLTSATGQAVAVGSGGAVLERSGTSWTRVDAGLGAVDLLGVHGNPTQAFVCGDQGAFADRGPSRYWPQPFTTQQLTATFAAGTTLSDPVYAVGNNGLVFRNDVGGVQPVGVNNWKQMGGPEADFQGLRAISAASADDVYAVGPGGYVLHRRDGAWRRETLTQTTDLNAVLAVSATEVYAAGQSGLLLARRPSWAVEGTGVTGAGLNALATDGTTVYAVGNQGTWLEKPVGAPGTAWVAKSTGVTAHLEALAVVGTEVVAVGSNCTVVSKKGQAFTNQKVLGCSGEALFAAATSGGLLFVAGEGGFASQRGSTGAWTREYPGNTLETYNTAAARGSELWVGGTTGELYRRTGTTWTQVEQFLTLYDYRGVWLAPAGDLYAVGAFGVLHRP
ncbi:MAG: hypothetical protein K1X89_11385 [Myxococcaceae bacterium]|nr:hypothetical protein [Myxococcaceae bacterium]